MLRKLSSAVDSTRLRSFVKKANMPAGVLPNMDIHHSGSAAGQIYGQLAAPPTPTSNRVRTQFPITPRQLPPPPAAGVRFGASTSFL